MYEKVLHAIKNYQKRHDTINKCGARIKSATYAKKYLKILKTNVIIKLEIIVFI